MELVDLDNDPTAKRLFFAISDNIRDAIQHPPGLSDKEHHAFGYLAFNALLRLAVAELAAIELPDPESPEIAEEIIQEGIADAVLALQRWRNRNRNRLEPHDPDSN